MTIKAKLLTLGAALALIAAPAGAFADNLATGLQSGAAEGAKSGGPVGAVLGGVAGGVIGSVSGVGEALTGVAPTHWPSLQQYVRDYHIPSHSYGGQVGVGTHIPKGVTLYVVPQQYGDTRLLFTVVNGEIVLVHPRSRRVVQLISPA